MLNKYLNTPIFLLFLHKDVGIRLILFVKLLTKPYEKKRYP
jgi:hypothetical protein